MGDKRYRRIVWFVRGINVVGLAVLAVIVLADLGFGAQFALMGLFVLGGWAGLAYILLALRRLRRQTGGPDGLWIREELQQFQRDALFLSRAPRRGRR